MARKDGYYIGCPRPVMCESASVSVLFSMPRSLYSWRDLSVCGVKEIEGSQRDLRHVRSDGSADLTALAPLTSASHPRLWDHGAAAGTRLSCYPCCLVSPRD